MPRKTSPSPGNPDGDAARVLPFRERADNPDPRRPPGGNGIAADWEPEDGKDAAGCVQALAAEGLSAEEIRLVLARSTDTAPLDDPAFERALATGRVLGRIRMKQEQFKAALAGKVGAQEKVLARLGGDPDEAEEGAREFEVVRTIIQPEPGED